MADKQLKTFSREEVAKVRRRATHCRSARHVDKQAAYRRGRLGESESTSVRVNTAKPNH